MPSRPSRRLPRRKLDNRLPSRNTLITCRCGRGGIAVYQKPPCQRGNHGAVSARQAERVQQSVPRGIANCWRSGGNGTERSI